MFYITLYNLKIPIYGFMIFLALSFGIIISYFITKKFNIIFEDYILSYAYSFLFGFIMAKIFYIIVSYKSIDLSRLISDFQYLRAYLISGLVFYGGLIGVLLGLVIASKIHKIDTILIASAVSPTFPLMHALGRIGCHFTGCCYAVTVNFEKFYVVYNYPEHPMAGLHLFPVQITEAILNFILSIVLFYYLHKKGLTRRALYLYIICYSVIRFMLEFLRYDEARGKLLWFSTSQYISIILIVYFIYLWRNKDFKNEDIEVNLSMKKME